MKKLVVVMLMVMLVSGFAMAEKGDVEVGLTADSNICIYGVYNITDRITAGTYLGYDSDNLVDWENTLDPYIFGISIGYDVIQWKGNHIALGLGLNHMVSSASYTYKTVSYSAATMAKYSFNFKFGLVLGISIMPELVFNAYSLNDLPTEKIPTQYNTGFNAFIGWKF